MSNALLPDAYIHAAPGPVPSDIQPYVRTADLVVNVARFCSERGKKPEAWQGRLGDLVSSHEIREAKNGAACFSPALYRPGTTRGNANVESITMLVLDYDHLSHERMSTVFASINRLGWASCEYTTFRHQMDGADDWRFRLLLPLDRPVSPAELTPLRSEVHFNLGVDSDPQTSDPARIFYLPCCPPERTHLRALEFRDGRLLPVDALLREADSRHRKIPEQQPAQLQLTDLLRTRLSRVRSQEVRELLAPVLQGDAFANEGERDNRCFEIVGAIARTCPQASPEEIVALLRPSLDAMQQAEPDGALTPDNVHEKAVRALLSVAEWQQRRLARGDESELAQLLLEQLTLCGQLVFDAGVFYQYKAELGIWSTLPEHDLSMQLQGMAGRPVARGDSSVPLRVDSRTVSGALKLAAARAARPGFFASATPGVAFKNGFVGISKDGLSWQSHDPDNRARMRCDFDYNSKAPRPQFDAFMAGAFPPGGDSAEKQQLIREFVGSARTGIATERAKALVVVGEGRNGKSTLIKIVEALFPSESVSHISPHQLEDEYYRSELEGKLLNTVSEMPKADLLRTESFKAVIAGDAISARKTYGMPRNVHPRAGHIFAANALPSVDDPSRAFWNRLMLVEFNECFTGREDTGLADRIIETELPGVMVWALTGAHELMQRGPRSQYTIPASHNQALEDWRLNADQVLQFIEEETIPVSDPRCSTTGGDLYKAYVAWARGTGHMPLASNKFGERARKAVRSTKVGAVRRYFISLRKDATIAIYLGQPQLVDTIAHQQPGSTGLPTGLGHRALAAFSSQEGISAPDSPDRPGTL